MGLFSVYCFGDYFGLYVCSCTFGGLIMQSKYLLYAYYRHSPKFIKLFDSFEEAEKFKEVFTNQERQVPQSVNGFEFCYIEVKQR